MASIESKVLDPAIERFRKAASELALSRRNFLIAGAAGAAAAGAGLLSTPNADAQQPLHNGYSQLDVLNFLLQVKYVSATLYSFVTQGADLPPSSGATIGSAQVFNTPAKITFSSQQITDLFNEMYYDELNHVVDLRNLIESASSGQSVGGTAVAGRANLNLLGNSAPATTPASTPITTQSQAIAYARLLEDLSVSAAAGAAVYLSGTNLAYVTQMMAADGFHAGAVRLLAIETGAQYLPSELAYGNVTTSAETAVSFSGATTTGQSLIWAVLGAVAPAVGNVLAGIGIPAGAGGVITAVTSKSSVTPTGITVKNSSVINTVSSMSGVAVGQPITGTNIPAGAYISAINAGGGVNNTITISVNGAPANATASTTVSPTGVVTAGSAIVNFVSSVSGVLVGQPITGTGIPSGTTITKVSSSTASPLTIQMSANATASSLLPLNGVVAGGSSTILGLSSISGLVIGGAVSGPGIPAGATLKVFNTSSSVTISANATADGADVTPTGTLTNGSPTITGVSSLTGLVVGAPISGAGIPSGTTINSFGSGSITMSANATANGAVTLTVPTTVSLNFATTETVTTPTNETITIGQSQVTIAGAATATGVNTLSVLTADSSDVVPGDPGSASTSAKGPSAITGTSPTMYQGFFNTAGSGTSGATATPVGLVFARNFTQVLQVLLGTNSTNSLVTNQSSEGGFYPYGVTGTINAIQPS